MTREEAIKKLAVADGPHGKLFSQGNWARTLVLSLEILGLLNFDGQKPERKEDDDRIQG